MTLHQACRFVADKAMNTSDNIAALIMDILEMKTLYKYFTSTLINAMRKASGTHIGEN